MNGVRLSIGWVFLTALTAAGTFYATDELDQRVGLEKYQLHQKLGIARYSAPAVTKPAVSPAVIPVLNPPVSPPVNPALNPSLNPAPYQGPAVSPPNQPGGNPAPPVQIPYNTPPPVQTYRDPNVPGPTTSIPSRNGVLPNPGYQPPSVRQPNQQTNTPPLVAQNPLRQGGMQQQQLPQVPSSRSGDYNEVADRMKTVKSDAEASVEFWEGIRRSLPSNQPLRSGISSALNQMKRFTHAAEEALRAGDLATARHNLEQAEKQLETLRQFKE